MPSIEVETAVITAPSAMEIDAEERKKSSSKPQFEQASSKELAVSISNR